MKLYKKIINAELSDQNSDTLISTAMALSSYTGMNIRKLADNLFSIELCFTDNAVDHLQAISNLWATIFPDNLDIEIEIAPDSSMSTNIAS